MKRSSSLLAAVVVAVAITITGSAEAAQLTTPSLFIVAFPTTVDCMVTNVSSAPRDVNITILRSAGTGAAPAAVAGSSGVVNVAAGGVLSHRESIATNAYVYCEIDVTGVKGTVRGSMCAESASFPGCSTTVGLPVPVQRR